MCCHKFWSFKDVHYSVSQHMSYKLLNIACKLPTANLNLCLPLSNDNNTQYCQCEWISYLYSRACIFSVIVISRFLFHILQVFRLDFNNSRNKSWFAFIMRCSVLKVELSQSVVLHMNHQSHQPVECYLYPPQCLNQRLSSLLTVIK